MKKKIPSSSWPVAGPSGCKMTCSQQQSVSVQLLCFENCYRFVLYSVFYALTLDDQRKINVHYILKVQFVPHRKFLSP
jgi:hypothetical protein